jgi:hypothetical protein
VTNLDDPTVAESGTDMPEICWDVPVSYWLHAIPLHTLGSDSWGWAAGARFSYGLPENHPQPRALPTAAQVVAAFNAAGCHGEAWFTVEGPGAMGLPPCPDPGECAGRRGGLDLGEVTLTPADPAADHKRLYADIPVSAIGFRKPSPAAVLAALTALTADAGPLLVFDDFNTDQVLVIREGDKAADVAAHWPW